MVAEGAGVVAWGADAVAGAADGVADGGDGAAAGGDGIGAAGVGVAAFRFPAARQRVLVAVGLGGGEAPPTNPKPDGTGQALRSIGIRQDGAHRKRPRRPVDGGET